MDNSTKVISLKHNVCFTDFLGVLLNLRIGVGTTRIDCKECLNLKVLLAVEINDTLRVWQIVTLLIC